MELQTPHASLAVIQHFLRLCYKLKFEEEPNYTQLRDVLANL